MAEGNCDDALSELYEFLDGELTAEKRGQIQQHIDDCTPCIEAYEFENDLRHVISQKCRDTVPDDLRQRIADAIGKAQEPSS
jgi:mycothiol system anti-sigma-R factor